MTDVPPQLDLERCAREPIRVPGLIQPHGALLAVHPESLAMLQASANLAEFTGLAFEPGSAGWTVSRQGESLAASLRPWLTESDSAFLRTVEIAGRMLQVSAHKIAQGVLLEFESPATPRETLQALYPRLRRFVEGLGHAEDLSSLAELTVRELRGLTGFNRVMLYSFDAEGAGTVLAEDRDEALPPYYDLRFPAADIPAQARELYRMNRLRLIPSADYTPVPIDPTDSPLDGAPLDLGLASLRSVSPVHLEYMRNMGTLASMSISILVDGRLWGLISCHNAAPRGLNAELRNACDFIGQIVSLQIGERERAARAGRRIELKRIESELLARLAQSASFQEGLAEHGAAWLGIVGAEGAAVVTPERLATYGLTPSQPELEELAGWLRRRGFGEVFATDHLSAHWPQAAAFAGIASGMLAVSISQLHPSYIMWFREEVVRTVKWAGDPNKPATETAERLHPRQSFALWKENVRLRSLPWSEVEIESARDFRNAIVNFVLRRAEERAALSEQLRVSNQELEAFSYSISHDLRAPFRHIAGYSELLKSRLGELDAQSKHYLDSILEATLAAGQLVDDLLNFSQLGRASLSRHRVDVGKIVGEVRHALAYDIADREIEWQVDALPPAWGDASMLRQAFSNLIENAVKYSRNRDPAKIAVRGQRTEDEVIYEVSDNGVGFDMAYAGKLFGVFQRLHRADEFPGTGIGLALTKRIIDRHGGRVFARGEIDQGATVGFALPKPPEEKRLA